MAAKLGFRCLILGAGGHLLFDGPIEQALGDPGPMEAVHLAHLHRHRQGAHPELHNW